MASIKALSEISKKFIDVTPQRATQYEQGVMSPKKDWATATEAAESNFEAGVQAAIQKKRFGKGVKAAGTAKQQQGVKEKGISRWPVGVSLAQSAYEEGFKPYHEEIARTTLPQRFARRDPRNLNRVSAITKALGTKKETMS
jgi:hypothetical protein